MRFYSQFLVELNGWVISVCHYALACDLNLYVKLRIRQLESSQRPQTSANAMLFARWQHHIQFGSGFLYAPLKAMLTKISK